MIVGVVSFAYALFLTWRCYMPCPFWDEWVVVDGLANGRGPWSWSWLWAQSNEHRHVIPRFLIWLDFAEFGGKNVSLFVATLVFQILHWLAISYVIERFPHAPSFVKRTLQGLFAFCLFHLNQAENFTWAFQFSFVLPFLIGTLALIAICFFGRIARPTLCLSTAVLAPIVAATNLAGGMLIGPITIAIALLKRLPKYVIATLTGAFVLTTCAYLYGYHRSATDLPFLQALSKSKELFVYVLTFFGASWTKLLPHKERVIAFVSIACFAGICALTRRKRMLTSDFEWFLLAECGSMLLTALLTAFGRIQFGVGQAFASRYQTPALLYWASLAALLILAIWKGWPQRIEVAQACLLLVMIASLCTFPRIWSANVKLADERGQACRVVMSGHYDRAMAKKLYENTDAVEQARPFIFKVWRH